MDYGALPPEINSGRIYAGAGSAPMMAAASAWHGLAAELSSAATASETVISRLTGEEWRGPASTAMATAVAPYLAWMTTTASQAEQAAMQATVGAAAFEAAHAASVPPPVIAANRTQLMTLVATNILGQNTAAIAANEALYAAMWAQDAAAMYAYAATGVTASQLTPMTTPAQIANPAGTAAQATAVSAGTAATGGGQAAQLLSSTPNALQGLASPLAAAAPSALPPWLSSFLDSMNTFGSNSFVAAASQGLATAAVYIPPTLIPTMIGYLAGSGFNAVGGGATGAGLGALLAPEGALGSLGALGGAGAAAASGVSALEGLSGGAAAVSASVGEAATVGAFSAPAAWSAATPAIPTVEGTGWAVGSDHVASDHNSVAAMPAGMAGAGAGGRGGYGFGAPRYGVKPIVMQRPIVVG